MTLMNGLDGNKIECKLNEFHCFDVNSLTCVPCQNIICGSDVDASCSRLLQYMNVRQTRQLAASRCEYIWRTVRTRHSYVFRHEKLSEYTENGLVFIVEG